MNPVIDSARGLHEPYPSFACDFFVTDRDLRVGSGSAGWVVRQAPSGEEQEAGGAREPQAAARDLATRTHTRRLLLALALFAVLRCHGGAAANGIIGLVTGKGGVLAEGRRACGWLASAAERHKVDFVKAARRCSTAEGIGAQKPRQGIKSRGRGARGGLGNF